jgi:hypothetical protein
MPRKQLLNSGKKAIKAPSRIFPYFPCTNQISTFKSLLLNSITHFLK